MRAAYLIMEPFAVLMLLLLLLSIMTEKNYRKEYRYFICTVWALVVALLGDFAVELINGTPGLTPLAYVMMSINYIGGYIAINFFLRYLSDYTSNSNRLIKRVILVLDSLCALSVIAVFINVPFGFYFCFDQNSNYIIGDWYILSNLYSIIVLVVSIVIICRISGLSRKERIIFLSFPVFPLVGVIADFVFIATPLTYVGAFLSVFIVYLWIFAKRGQRIASQEAELAENRISMMLSQIKPHFMYNTLLCIQELCRRNPLEAEQAIMEFSMYLRGNLDSLNSNNPISFEQEMQHTKNYLSLEQKRFGRRLSVKWDIKTTDFKIPPLTLQPIAENAVRHGVTKRREGGTVKITVAEDGAQYIIKVNDNGIGFDPAVPPNDSSSHVGINNVRERIQRMMNGSVIVESRPQKGTTVTIVIPKEMSTNGNIVGR